jgi:hypothetical protein
MKSGGRAMLAGPLGAGSVNDQGGANQAHGQSAPKPTSVGLLGADRAEGESGSGDGESDLLHGGPPISFLVSRPGGELRRCRVQDRRIGRVHRNRCSPWYNLKEIVNFSCNSPARRRMQETSQVGTVWPTCIVRVFSVPRRFRSRAPRS